MNAVVKNHSSGDFKVADMNLADWGRKESTSPSRKCRA
jgi:hypothetical protein